MSIWLQILALIQPRRGLGKLRLPGTPDTFHARDRFFSRSTESSSWNSEFYGIMQTFAPFSKSLRSNFPDFPGARMKQSSIKNRFSPKFAKKRKCSFSGPLRRNELVFSAFCIIFRVDSCHGLGILRFALFQKWPRNSRWIQKASEIGPKYVPNDYSNDLSTNSPVNLQVFCVFVC